MNNPETFTLTTDVLLSSMPDVLTCNTAGRSDCVPIHSTDVPLWNSILLCMVRYMSWKNLCLRSGSSPICLQMTSASWELNSLSQMVPQALLMQISTLPSSGWLPPSSLRSPVLQSDSRLDRAGIQKRKRHNDTLSTLSFIGKLQLRIGLRIAPRNSYEWAKISPNSCHIGSTIHVYSVSVQVLLYTSHIYIYYGSMKCGMESILIFSVVLWNWHCDRYVLSVALLGICE